MAVPALCVVELPRSARSRAVGAVAGLVVAGPGAGLTVAGDTVRAGALDVRERRRRAAGRRRRRRRVFGAAAACGVGAVVALLSLPLAITGGAPVGAASGAGVGALSGRSATVYVVQAGDTLWSIASRFDSGGDVRPFAEALARQTGSSVVVPGEHITIP